MHIPDGFLSNPVMVATNAAALVTAGFAVKKASEDLDERKIPLMGVTTAFVFAAQMLNFPIVGGTSGHVLGGLLAALLLGPNAGMVVMTVVLIVQALLFNDGGILALGANIFNMAFIGSWCCYWVYRWLAKISRNETVAVAVSAWLSVFLGAIACALELALSGTAPLVVVVAAMASIHAVIGIGEALVTVAAFAFLKRTKPELVRG
ncbi:MAG: energy-coupling factor ABC transporter permease [Armatimonadetes bacterium]|nr:energy-coupling factor ABC transporter permease [Armatimonadota bacterium]MCX7969469.1 energy-coupling factor ABC transporter permease [Armatimonadota bacterium]MDW8143918.1 energy-coupling factor ABC transporter permease [Armatimonadota bacterium]